MLGTLAGGALAGLAYVYLFLFETVPVRGREREGGREGGRARQRQRQRQRKRQGQREGQRSPVAGSAHTYLSHFEGFEKESADEPTSAKERERERERKR